MPDTIAANIRAILKARDLKESLFADSIGFDRGTFSKIVNGKLKVSRATLKVIAAKLGMTPDGVESYDPTVAPVRFTRVRLVLEREKGTPLEIVVHENGVTVGDWLVQLAKVGLG